MPGGDKTGPIGYGPLTGRGMGSCGAGLGRGRGFRRCFYRTPISLTMDEEAKILEAELKEIEAEKEAIEKRLKEMK